MNYDNNVVNVGLINHTSTISVSKEIAPEVKVAQINNNTVPLFPTKSGYEYYVFRTPVRR